MPSVTRAERAAKLEVVEGLMLRFIDEPAIVARMAGIGDQRTAARYIEEIRRKWYERDQEPERRRKSLIEQAQETIRAAYDLATTAAARKKYSAVGRGLEIVLKGQQRIAKLLGLERVDLRVSFDPDEVNRLQRELLAQPVAGSEDSVRGVYGAIPLDPGQGRSDHPAAPEPATAPGDATQAGGGGTG